MATGDLCQLADVKAWLAIPSDSTSEDSILSRLITATSLDFLHEISRMDFTPAKGYTETLEGDGGNRITVRHWPINSVTSVKVGDSAISESTDRIADGFYTDTDLEPEQRWEVYLAGAPTFTDGATVVITYNAGYDTVPPDAEQAVIEWVSYRYKMRQFIGQVSKHMAQGETAQVQQVLMPPTTQRVVERYRRAHPALDQQTDAAPSRGARGTALAPQA